MPSLAGLTLADRMESLSAPFSPSGGSPGSSQRGANRMHRTEPFLIGVAGGTASGKTTVCDQIMQRLHGEVTETRTAQCTVQAPAKLHQFLVLTNMLQAFLLMRRSMRGNAISRFILPRVDPGRESRRQK